MHWRKAKTYLLSFETEKEAILYAEKKWKTFFESLSYLDRMNLLSIQGSGLKKGEDILNTFRKVFEIIPPFDEDVIVYRGGVKKDFKQCDLLPASFVKNVAERFAKAKNGKVFVILVRKGAKAIPDCGLGIMGCGPEAELILDPGRIHRKGNIYEYY